MPATAGLSVALQQYLYNKVEDINPVAATASFLLNLFEDAEEPEIAGISATDIPLGRGGAVATAARLTLGAGDAGMMALANSGKLAQIISPDEPYDSSALAYARNIRQSYSPPRAHKHSIPKVNKPKKVRGI